MTPRSIALLSVALVATACAPGQPPGEPGLAQSLREAPPGAAPGTCWGKQVTPAVVETVTEQVLLHPASYTIEGQPLKAAVYRTETRQAILREREVTWFRAPCEDARTPDFIASLQRALKVRGLYKGPVNGQMDARTRAAVRAFQAPRGLQTGVLSLDSARDLGLVAVERPEAG
ncbi:MAG TPA: peptidoglycan-binding domain-containing protein [Roseovarius sp.]|nr:peptidoglycan-binding domain-containing protein [Roseovarius sp.]